jgi:hypothetical protein
MQLDKRRVRGEDQDKTSLFTDEMNEYLQNPRESNEKLLQT